ncbi:unnamed protein product, partial [Closterium sp. NIES-53]
QQPGELQPGSLTRIAPMRSHLLPYAPVSPAYASYLSIFSPRSYLHTHHVVPRDLKSDNILVSYKGSAKIADFG